MKNSRANRHNDRGFTLPEVLLTVAILVVLFALAAIPVTKMQRELRQTELDAKAEILFQTAQNRITQLMAAGMGEKCQLGAQQRTTLPADADEDNYTGEKPPIFYITDIGKEDPKSAACYILPKDGTEPELWGSHWVVEFDKDSGSVYAVFYSEKDLSAYPEGFQLLRSRDYRVKEAAIGYYGGDSVMIRDTGVLKPTVHISNGEKLEIEVNCTAPDASALTFRVTLRNSNSNSEEKAVIVFSGDEVMRSGPMNRDYVATMVLDDLSEGSNMRFAQQARLKDLSPGSNLTVTVDVTSANRLIEPAVWQGETNGLFDTVRDDNTAVITCARHLQNLDESSKVIETITAAVQEQNIDFTGAGSWSDTYPGLKFKPIRNIYLASYRSYVKAADIEVYPVIAHLPVEPSAEPSDKPSGSAGLFESFAGTISGVRLSGARIYGDGNVGALIGKVTGNVTLDNCRVYLDPRSDALSVKDEKDIWIKGKTAGGLIGYIGPDGSADVTASFAATVLHGSVGAGGLIGRVDGAASLDRCYADCYLYSDETSGRTGGLIGGTGEYTGVATKPVNLKNCYAAGFQKASVTAGLSAGTVYSMTSCYSAVVGLETARLTYSTAAACAGTAGAKVKNTFYLAASIDTKNDIKGTTHPEWNGTNRADAAQQLKDGSENSFTSVTGGGSTVAYNLMKGMGLSDYSYPKLKGIPHYGDWKAEFESGSLAYYERYRDGSYGFLGGNVQVPLSNTGIVGDGYGVVYNERPTAAVEIKYKNAEATSKKATLDPKEANAIVEISYGDKTYYLLPLPNEAVNTAYVPAESFYQEIEIGGTTYLYAPHFARTVTTPGEDGTTEKPESVVIRTARQLYDLSLYYEAYASTIAENAGFTQESDIDYDTYEWKSYTLVSNAMPTLQMPIGSRESAPFRHTYDGSTYAIKDAPISGSNLGGGDMSVYAGLFGYNCGRLQNIVLLSGKTNSTVIGFDKGIQHKTAYVGTVVGYNEGRVYNCAGAGYRVKVLANSGSTVYVGGFAGYNGNDGRIDRCSVSIPSIYAESVFAQLSAGGFIGGNEGRIDRSYGIAAVNVPTIRGGAAKLGGFAAANGGIIRRAYCATAMFSAGAETDGFASSGSVRECHYLNGGTYRFVGEDRLYNVNTMGGAQPETAKQLKELPLDGFGTATESLYHENTEEEQDYPYPSCVQKDGKTVHYGDWPVPTNAGELGMFYWEKEEGGANDGYHFSYIGFVGTERKEGSTLCTVHDDGGVVTAYGYGYYWEKNTQDQPALTLSSSFNVTGGETKEAKAAVEALSAQMPDYGFTAYETGKTGLRLQSADDANGVWKLTSTKTATASEYSYTVCPFFANAFSDQVGESADKPGSAGKPYQIRSVEQLQFINWSWSKNQGCTDRVVTGDTYKSFPYLQYATGTDLKNKQTREAAEDKRPAQSWKQTHDLNGANRENPSDGTKNTPFYPIASAKYEADRYKVVLYNWFGGKYDGQNYYIKNVNIDSNCYNVGLFATTAGAMISNIVLYSDNGGVIQRKTKATDTPTAYALGGLVGIAYDYLYDSDGNEVKEDARATITNCAIAGYTIQDNSRNPLQLGEAVVGGLIGVSKVNLNRCSAVVDIAVNCTHRKSDDRKSTDWNQLTYAQYGNYVRVGGMVGGVQYKVTNCYTGGSITIGADTLNERMKNGRGLISVEDSKTKQAAKVTEATYVYIGGIGGSGFSSNFVNFSGKSETDDGQPSYINCYTYVEFPTMQGTIMAISRIGSIADRYQHGSAKVTIENCYYLNSTITYNLPEYYANSSLSKILAGDTKEKMLNGDLSYVRRYFDGSEGDGGKYIITSITGLTYQQLAGMVNIGEGDKGQNILPLLNGTENAFSRVTTEEVGASIHGKYSFPGKKKDVLNGQDYPFPTVLTQKSNHTDGYVNLHYGDWPVTGPAWESSRVTIDRIADYKPESGRASREVKLRLQNMTDASLTDVKLALTGSGASIVEIAESKVVEETAADGEKDTYLLVTLTGLKNGSAEITATLNESYVARLTVSVTAQLSISLPDFEANNMITVNEGSDQTLTLKATMRDGVLTAEKLKWSVGSADPGIAEVYAKNGVHSVRGEKAGETTLLIKLSYELNENTTIETSRIVPVTVYEKADGK